MGNKEKQRNTPRSTQVCADRSWTGASSRINMLPLNLPSCKVIRRENTTHKNTVDFRLGKPTQWDDKKWKEEQKCLQQKTGSCLGCPILEMAKDKVYGLPIAEAEAVARQVERNNCMWDTRMQIDKLGINKRRNKW